MSRPRRPACGKPLRAYQLSRLREYEDESPVCGKGEGHRGNCVSAESLEHTDKNRKPRERHG